jgi:hypothetical protein
MEKYATYRVFKNEKTGEIIRVKPGDSLEKVAKDMSDFKELQSDPEVSENA